MEASEGKVENHMEPPENKVENHNDAPDDKVENRKGTLEDEVENRNDDHAPEDKVENHIETPEDEVENQNYAPDDKVENLMGTPEDEVESQNDAPGDKVENHIETPEDEVENQNDGPEDKVEENHMEAPEDKVENHLESPEDKEENQDQESVVIPPVIYRCKKCRRIVATQDLVIPHERGEGQECFSYGKKNSKTVRFIGSRKRNEAETPECTSIFVEPMNWMESVTQYGCVGDKIVCMGCKARLGSFHWAGMRCNCGKYITPAFQLHKNRLDESSF